MPGRAAHTQTIMSVPSAIKARQLKEQVDRLDRELTPHAVGFSEALGDASRAITALLIVGDGG